MFAAGRSLLAALVLVGLAVVVVQTARVPDSVSDLSDADAVRAVIAARPLAGEAYRRLAELTEATESTDQTARLYGIAARREPRDRASHVWLADHFALSGDTTRALHHIDQLMRLRPGRAHRLFPTLGSLLATPDSRTQLVGFLASAAPPWRAPFLRWAAAQPGIEAWLAELFEPLRHARAPLTVVERGYWLDRLVRDGRLQQAYFLWIDGLPEARRQEIGNVYDGGFELEGPPAGHFDWAFLSVAGAAVSRARTTGMSGEQALLVEFFDQRVPFEHVQQQLALPAGSYVLSGRVRIEDLRNERGLVWRLRCGSETLVDSEHFRGSSAWREFRTEFSVPAQNCAGQTLQLRLDARIRPEQMIGGRIWFDDLRISRQN